MQLQGPVGKVKRRICDPASSEATNQAAKLAELSASGVCGDAGRSETSINVEVRTMILG